MNKTTGRVAMVLVDPRDKAALDFDGLQVPGFERTIIRLADFDHLDEASALHVEEVKAEGVEFVLYSRDDQVFDRRPIGPAIRRFQVGYSTMSGIDTDEAFAQAKGALDDLRRGKGTFAPPPPAPPSVKFSKAPFGTFSFIFDTERMGCIRVGLPRILPLLDHYGVKATFFVTGFVARLYPDLLPALAERGHEIGIHGPNHEWMAGLPLEEQRRRLGDHLEEFRRHYPVVGANFIFRQDTNTLHALAGMGIQYGVAFALHHYRPFAYRQISTQPVPLWTSEGSLWMIPIPVETYESPWWDTRLLIDSALARSREETGKEHVTVLMHPFRDGTKAHLRQLEAMLNYLVVKRELCPVTLRDRVAEPAPAQPDTRVYTAIARIDNSHPEGYGREFWSRTEYYFDRLAKVVRVLKASGREPALTLDPAGADYAVYPEAPEGGQSIPFDPMVAAVEGSPGWCELYDLVKGQTGPGMKVFSPPDAEAQKAVIRSLNRPRHLGDVLALAPEAAIRVAHRLRKNRVLF